LISNITIHSEKVLFRQIAEGDETAFREIFHHYNKMLQPFIRKLTRSDQAAEEVLQEVFLKIWLYRKKLAQVENPKAYIVRIVSNESMNYLRGLARDSRLFDRIQQSPGSGSLSPEQSFAARETEKLIEAAIERLPFARKQIYRMSREENKRIPEIAAALRLSDSTVKNQLVKALKSIRLYIVRASPLLILSFFTR
jgi:RNA polymerase sigma-70 factor (ECF subfamily)